MKESLYYNKYKYRLKIKISGSAYYISKVKDIQEYDALVKSVTTELGRRPYYINADYDSNDRLQIAKLILYYNEFVKKKMGTTRKEHSTITFFSNDLKFLKKAPINERSKLYEADISPAGIKYFKKDPPASYRVYFNGSKVSIETKKQILDYVTRTDGVEASSSVMNWLNRPWQYSWHSYFIDYNDSSQLMMMTLLFNEVLGKKYKLEKK
jgi:hypothetical protein